MTYFNIEYLFDRLEDIKYLESEEIAEKVDQLIDEIKLEQLEQIKNGKEKD
jgi:hypothetical protein